MEQTIILTIMMVVMMYFMAIRPENKRKKEQQAMREGLKVGDEITTIGGINGVICAIKDNTIVFETGADRVRLEIAKWAIATAGLQTVETPK